MTPRSGKTTAGHFRYARYLIQSEDENHLVAAYNQEQAYRLFIDGDGTGLMHIFDGNCWIKHDERGDHLLIDTPNDTQGFIEFLKPYYEKAKQLVKIST